MLRRNALSFEELINSIAALAVSSGMLRRRDQILANPVELSAALAVSSGMLRRRDHAETYGKVISRTRCEFRDVEAASNARRARRSRLCRTRCEFRDVEAALSQPSL